MESVFTRARHLSLSCTRSVPNFVSGSEAFCSTSISWHFKFLRWTDSSPSLEDSLCRLFATAYSLYSHLSFTCGGHSLYLLTWGHAMPWWKLLFCNLKTLLFPSPVTDLTVKVIAISVLVYVTLEHQLHSYVDQNTKWKREEHKRREMQRKKMTENKNRGDGKCQDEEEWMKKENLKQQTELLFICSFHTG